MGSVLSEPANCFSSQNNTDLDGESFVSNDILLIILSFVPDDHLLRNCRSVCKNWKDIIDGQSLWKLKCEKENFPLKCSLKEIPEHFYRCIYMHQKYEQNFISNPCECEKKFNGWTIPENNGDKFAIEYPPCGCDHIPEEAASYSFCTKSQKIDLWRKSFHRFLLQHDAVKLRVGEWYAARFVCDSIYRLHVTLLSEDMSLVDEFLFEFEEEQWTGRKCHLVTHEFENLSKVRYVHFKHSGRDHQFWAGHYGSKKTGAFVKLVLK